MILNQMQWFWVFGLVAIGFTAFLICRGMKLPTTRETQTMRNIAVWGAVMATLWIFYGGLLVFLSSLSKN